MWLVSEMKIYNLRVGTLMKHKINVDKIHLFEISKKNKKYKKKIKKQAKIINGLLDFLEKLGYDKKRWAYWEKNGRREYTNVSIPNSGNLIQTITNNLFEDKKEQKVNNLISIPRMHQKHKARKIGLYEDN